MSHDRLSDEVRKLVGRRAWIEAADLLLRNGRLDDAVGLLMSVRADDPAYVTAVSRATRILWDHELPMADGFSDFVDPFMRSGPSALPDGEVAAGLYGLARLYERLDVRDRARAAYRAVLRMMPGFLDSELRLQTIEREVLEARRLEQMQASGEIHARIATSGETTAESMPAASAPEDESVALRGMTLGLGPVRAGTVVAGRYVLDRPVGEGGYAVVWSAWDAQGDRPIALKLFRRDTRDPKGYARFRAEMKITTRFRHPNIVKVYEVGVWRSACYIAMELLSGLDLFDWLRSKGGRAPLLELQPLMVQALEGLHAAHGIGVIHRDIKPRNLFVLDGGARCKVMDFGLAVAVDVTGDHTRTGRVVGTPAYLAPERLRPAIGEVGPPADIYALGVVFFEALTGQLPFYEERLPKLFRRILDEPPPPPSSFNPQVPRALDTIICRMMAKKPTERYDDCLECVRALDTV
ncbi:MAG: serine/threonine protein kinase [Proteobacteria bacterium]|nr:serine/threonine protein kinase [Pseudomonadota bacterium]